MLRFSDPVIGTKKEREPVPPSGKKDTTHLPKPRRNSRRKKNENDRNDPVLDALIGRRPLRFGGCFQIIDGSQCHLMGKKRHNSPSQTEKKNENDRNDPVLDALIGRRPFFLDGGWFPDHRRRAVHQLSSRTRHGRSVGRRLRHRHRSSRHSRTVTAKIKFPLYCNNNNNKNNNYNNCCNETCHTHTHNKKERCKFVFLKSSRCCLERSLAIHFQSLKK